MKMKFTRSAFILALPLLSHLCTIAQKPVIVHYKGHTYKSPTLIRKGAKGGQATAPSSAYGTLDNGITLNLTRQSQIDSVPILYPGVTTVQDIFVNGDSASPAIIRLDSLKYITEVTGQLNIAHTQLTNLNGLSGLQRIGWLLNLDNDTLLTNIKPPNITYINGLFLNQIPLFTSFSGFLNGLTNTRLDYFWIFNNVGITDFNGLQAIDSINHLGCWGLPHFTSFNGLQQLNYLEELDIWGNGQLTDVSAFSNITKLQYYSLQISYNYNLTSWNGLQNITYINGNLHIQGAQFSSLAATGLNANLVIQSDTNWNGDDTLQISDNPNMSVCNWPPLCNFLAAGNPAHIYNNSPGCESVEDVQASCGACDTVYLRTWNGSVDNDWNNAGNWTPVGVPQSCDSVVVNNVMTHPQLSSNTVIHALTMNEGEIYMNGYNLTVNGDANLENVYMGASGGPSESFTVNNARVINISNSTLYMPFINLTHYHDSLTLINNNLDKNVIISDAPSRIYNFISGNTFGSLNYTSNSTNPDEYSEISGDSDDQINGNFTINILNHDENFYNQFYIGRNNQVHVGGDLIVNNNVADQDYLQINNIEFKSGNTGSNDCHITQVGSQPIRLGTIATYKGGVYPNPFSSIILDQNVYVAYSVHLGIGHIKTSADNELILKPGAGFSQWSSASWIWGPLKVMSINAGSEQIYPIGDSIYRGETYLKNAGNNDLNNNGFTVEYFHKNPSLAGYDTSKHDLSVAQISGNEYWKFKQDSATGTMKVMLRYDPITSQPSNSVYGLRVCRWNGTMWKDFGAARIDSGGWAIVTPDSSIINSSDIGIYTLGYKNNYHRPVITIQNSDTAGCSGGYIWLRWKVDSAMLSNNTFSAFISDSSGNFVFNNGLGYFIGSKTSNHSDSMYSQLTYNLPWGKNYRIRLLGSQPADTSNTWRISVSAPPNKTLAITGPSTVCGQSTVKYYVSQRDSAGTGYTWYLNGGTFTQNMDTIWVTWTNPYYSNSYQGYISVSANNTCGSGPASYIQPMVYYAPSSDTPVVFNMGRKIFLSKVPSIPGLTINWYRNGTLISGANANPYYASLSGNYTANFSTTCANGPVSNTISFATNSIAQSINFPAIPNHQYGDAPFAFNGSATSGLPVIYTIISGPGTISGNIYTLTGTGSVTIQASQPGDNTYDTAAPVTQTFMINKASQAITFAALPNVNYTTVPFTLTATAGSNLPVTYTLISGPATVYGNNVSLTGLGTVTIQASQAGDGNYAAASPISQSFCVTPANLNSISGANSICPGTPTIYSVNAIPGATYAWRIAGGSTLPSTTNSATVTWPAPGNYTLIVSASGSCGAPTLNDSLMVTAVASAQPDSVHGMLPANGTVNLQLPLNLSWIPANPNLYYTYDIYLWKASDAQPSTPYVSGVTNVNYVIPLNAGLVYNTPYKWMVVAHNGSCTQINTGPIQQFTLIPLPDLQVYNVQAPASIFSGQNMTATWSVKNNGPGNTLLNQGWTDAVFISKDSVLDLFNVNGILQFPVVPQLVASVSNPSGLNNGQLYNSSANFTIPINYSGPLYVHVVTNYNPPAINPVVENNYANDTAHALPATIVTLSPQPDFQVDTVFTPNNVFSGNTITVSYKVHNHGAAAASGNWVDKIYISKDPLFNPASATLLKFANAFGTYYPAYDAMINRSGALLPDSSYNANAQVVIPNFIYGNYYVYVFTNATGSIYEGANNSNNVNHGPLMQVFLTATPNIVSANVQVPKNASNTQTVAVTWKENNLGANDNLQKNKGHYSASNGTCAVCVSYATDNNGNTYCSKTAIVPNYKDSVGFGGSYWVDQLFLSQDSTFNSNTAAYISNANFGNEFSGYNVNDNIYPSNCGAPLVNQNTFPVLAPNSSFPGVYNYQIPDKLPQGNYYIYVYSNATNSVYQYPGTPSITRSNLFTIAWPDLKVPSVSVPATGNSGQPLTVNYNVQNSGHGGLFNHYRKDYIYLGNNSAFDGTAVLIDSVVYSSATVDTNVVQTLQRQSILPNGISGLKYVFVKVNVDTTFKETSFTNNTNVVGAPVNISLTPSSNFTFNSLSIPNTVYSSTGFPIKYTINNVGAGLASGNWIDSIFISCSSTFNSATAYFVGLRSEQQYIPAGGSYSDSFNLIVPQTYLINNNGCMAQDTLQPYFFVKSNANNNIYQPVKTGNTGTTPQVTFINKTIDLITTSVSGADSALAGRPYKINWSVKNLGLNPNDGTYSSYNDAVWLSPDTVLNNSSLIIGNKNENTRLDRNQSYSDSATFNLGNIPSGYYYLLVKTNPYNQLSGERNINNNLNVKRDVSSVPKKVFVGNPISPDLRDTILSVPSVVAAGQPFTVVYKVTNSGQGATYGTQWSDAVWLSVNFQPSYIFGKNQTRTLAPGQSYIDSVTIILPTNYTPGNYILGVRANYYQQLFESDYSNNTAYNYISVYVPPPVDLIVNNINMADTVVLGNVASVQYQLKNISNNVANGIETDGVYLSADSSLTSDGDILMSTVNNTIKILPLNDTALATALRISGVTEGSYYVKVKADILNNIPETNKDNNTGLMNKKVYVKVKELFMNVPASDTLTGNFLYYKLVVPSAFKGATIMVQLQTPDSVTTANQLYLGLGYVPSAARFDYAFNKPNYGNQQIVIETVLDSVYYIAARGNKPGNGYQLINLSAVALPFTILNVNSNKGGNTGNVTVLLNGSLFRQGMVATLKGAGNNTITASAVYFVNSTSAYATFNLQGAPLGLYDVSLTKPDNSVATLTSGFTVQVTDNGGLLTGGGSNTGQTGNGNTPGCDPGAPSGLNAQLQTEIVIPPKVFVGWPFQMQINFVNTSNVDIPTQVRTLYSVDGAPVGLSQNDLSAGKTTMTIEFKNPNLPGGVIPAGSSGTITIWSKAPANAFAHQKIHFNLK